MTETQPKLFISYSWSTEEHQAWVLRLAEQLVGNGVDVTFDKWDLKHGNDTHAFMEILDNPEIDKVAMICDRKYVEKANSRSGGVGIEAQIITPGIYESHRQTRYVALVVERDEVGKALVPTYYGSKKYIDFTDPLHEAQAFEELLRWVYEKPLNVRPKIGQRPAFLDDNHIVLPTASAQRRALDAIQNHRPYAVAALTEYFDLLAKHLEEFRIKFGKDDTDEIFIKSIEMFLPYRNEAIEIFVSLARYMDIPDTREAVHGFFEKLIPYQSNPPGVNQWMEIDYDNFRFITHELFLYGIAAYIKDNKYDAIIHIVEQEYYISDPNKNTSSTTFEVFYEHLKCCEWRNERLKKGRASLRADILIERCSNILIDVQDLLAADFLLFLRAGMVDDGSFWFPVTLLFTNSKIGYNKAFAVFAKATSRGVFDRLKTLFRVNNGDEFREKLTNVIASGRGRSSGYSSTPNISALANSERIDTKP